MTRLAAVLALLAASCDWSLQRMVDQERCEPSERTRWLADGLCAQARPEGVVAYEAPVASTPELTGMNEQAVPVDTIPVALSHEVLRAGRVHFERFCAPCHGLLGDGVSQVAENMALRRPPSLVEGRVVQLADGHVFRVVTSGYGLMPSYAHALDEGERWGVVAYVRVLAHSQRAVHAQLPPDIQAEARSWLH